MPPGRTHLIGLDKPTAAPLRSAADQLVTLRAQARWHEQHRLESVSELLALVGVMRMRKALTGKEMISVIGASRDGFQWGEGIAEHRTVAAHCIPGHLQIDSFPVHRMPTWTEPFLRNRGLKPLQLDSKLKNVCARTDVVDEVVNKTDNLIEKMSGARGLKPELGSAVRELSERIHYQRPDTAAGLSELLSASLGIYRQRAGIVCEARLHWLAHELKAAGSEPKLLQRQRQIEVANEYLRVVQDRSFVPEAGSLAGVEDIFRDVTTD
ncbi:MAG: hypothetical protein U1G07_07070 [Verrucomicrobiota bacterium]